MLPLKPALRLKSKSFAPKRPVTAKPMTVMIATQKFPKFSLGSIACRYQTTICFTLYRFFRAAALCLAVNWAAVALAQSGGGALFDESRYVGTPLAAPLTQASYQHTNRYSLKPYCPKPGDQRESGTCVGWAVAYGARTIAEAVMRGWSTKADKPYIDQQAFSPSFTYNLILANEGISDCSVGGYIVDALDLLKTKGSVPISQFPFDEDCQHLPNAELLDSAISFCIKDYHRITFYNKDDAKTDKVREYIANDMPVIVGIKILDNLKNTEQEKYTWNPQKGNPALAITHAMVVVGYDDTEKTFELMNSWGDKWCNEGFFYITYEDFNQYVREAYVLIFDRPALKNRNDQITLSASIDFKRLDTEGVAPDVHCQNQSIGRMSATLCSDSSCSYRMINSYAAWTGYQTYITTQSQNKVVYAFSYDLGSKTTLLYPFQPDVIALYGAEQGTTITPLIPIAGSTIALPHEDYCMQLDEQGGTVNCFLFSRQPIDIKTVCQKIETGYGNFQERLTRAIPDNRRANPNVGTYSPDSIGVEANRADHASVPIVVDLNHQ